MEGGEGAGSLSVELDVEGLEAGHEDDVRRVDFGGGRG